MATKTKKELGLCSVTGCRAQTRGKRSMCEVHRAEAAAAARASRPPSYYERTVVIPSRKRKADRARDRNLMAVMSQRDSRVSMGMGH